MPISSHFKGKKPIQATFKVDLHFADAQVLAYRRIE
jgi:hypothetical protein